MKHFNFIVNRICANTPPCCSKRASRFVWVLVLMLTLGAGQMWGADATTTFAEKPSNKTWANVQSSLPCAAGGNVWSSSVAVYGWDNSRSFQFTCTANSGVTVSLTSSDFQNKTIKSVSVVASRNKSYDVTLAVTVNGNTLGDGDSGANNESNATLTTSSTTGIACGTGNVVITLSTGAPSSKPGSLYVKSITVTYETSSGPTLYTVTYDANEGSVTPASHTQASAGASITLATPTRTGYTFNGWYTATTGGTKRGNAGASYTPTSDETVHAQWAINNYAVHWKVNGEDWEGSTHGNPSTSANHGNKPATIPTAPVSNDCDGTKVFVGWTATEINGSTNTFPADLFTTVDASPQITAETTFHAVFANGGTVTFNSSLSGITNSSKTWTHTSSGISFSLTGNYSSYSSPTWTIGYGSSGTYGTITVPSGKYLANVDVTLYNKNNKIVSVSNGVLTPTTPNTTSQNIIFRANKTTTQLYPATSSTQTKINQLVITWVSSTPAFATTCCHALGSINGSFS